MDDLPKEGIIVTLWAFQDVNLVFGGPFVYKVPHPENNSAYLGLFVCLTSKALHKELVSDLTTATRIAASRRFTSRRGCPTKLYSDNATNFTNSGWDLERLH